MLELDYLASSSFVEMGNLAPSKTMLEVYQDSSGGCIRDDCQYSKEIGILDSLVGLSWICASWTIHCRCSHLDFYDIIHQSHSICGNSIF